MFYSGKRHGEGVWWTGVRGEKTANTLRLGSRTTVQLLAPLVMANETKRDDSSQGRHYRERGRLRREPTCQKKIESQVRDLMPGHDHCGVIRAMENVHDITVFT